MHFHSLGGFLRRSIILERTSPLQNFPNQLVTVHLTRRMTGWLHSSFAAFLLPSPWCFGHGSLATWVSGYNWKCFVYGAIGLMFTREEKTFLLPDYAIKSVLVFFSISIARHLPQKLKYVRNTPDIENCWKSVRSRDILIAVFSSRPFRNGSQRTGLARLVTSLWITYICSLRYQLSYRLLNL